MLIIDIVQEFSPRSDITMQKEKENTQSEAGISGQNDNLNDNLTQELGEGYKQ
jgi:hypothetical protein